MDPHDNQSRSLVRKSTDVDLMPPPPAAKRIKRPKTVIDEDSYTDALSQIIARDFFPGLHENESKQEYLDALESQDASWISRAGKRLQQTMTPMPHRSPSIRMKNDQTPSAYGANTPAPSIGAPSVATSKSAIDTDMSLASFQAKYTSEDNESFYKLMDKHNQKKLEKYAWMWEGNKLPSKQMIKQAEVEARLSETTSLVDDGFSKRSLLAIKDVDERPARPDSWDAQPINNLMFKHDGVDDESGSLAQLAQAESNMPPKKINHHNTRMPEPGMNASSKRPPSPTLSAVRDAISGRPRNDDVGSSVVGGSETPRVNGYAFVDDEEDEKASEPLPAIDLGPGDATPNPFRLQEQRKRESLHHRLVERASQSKRESKRVGMTGKPDKTPVPKFPSSPKVSGGLTPAAQRLWGQIGNRKSGSSPGISGAKMTPLRGRGSLLKSVSRQDG